MENLEATRKTLQMAEYNSYSPSNFPGSKGWLKNQAAAKALADFDAKHPEVIEAINAAKAQPSTPSWI